MALSSEFVCASISCRVEAQWSAKTLLTSEFRRSSGDWVAISSSSPLSQHPRAPSRSSVGWKQEPELGNSLKVSCSKRAPSISVQLQNHPDSPTRTSRLPCFTKQKPTAIVSLLTQRRKKTPPPVASSLSLVPTANPDLPQCSGSFGKAFRERHPVASCWAHSEGPRFRSAAWLHFELAGCQQVTAMSDSRRY